MADEDLWLTVRPGDFVLQGSPPQPAPAGGVKSRLPPVPSLIIKRDSREMLQQTLPLSDKPTAKIRAVLGIFQLLTGPYLGVVTQSRCVGELHGHKVHVIKKVSLVPFKGELEAVSRKLARESHSDSSDSLSQAKALRPLSMALFRVGTLARSSKEAAQPGPKPDDTQPVSQSIEAKAASDIARIFSSGTFYFSKTLDLTNSFQKRGPNPPPGIVFEELNPTFWWNQYVSAAFIEKKATGWVVPVIQGFVKVQRCQIMHESFDFALISRRSQYRAGLRYTRRGIDQEGRCANFVETEQVLSFMGSLISYVQVRGSIPLFWSQNPMSPKPRPVLSRSAGENMAAFRQHLEHLRASYGNIGMLSLVEKSGKESIVGQAFSQITDKYGPQPYLRYVAFDFHEACRGAKFDNIKVLIAEIAPEIEDSGFYWRGPDGFELVQQTRVFRTNCMDCLDRTNVVQTYIAKEVLKFQLLKLGLQGFPDKRANESFASEFNAAWAENGDAISKAYSGTSALKRDLTRFGRRTKAGIMNDGVNSLTRMYKNNFKDESKQVVIDFILGLHEADVFVKQHLAPSTVLDFGSVKSFKEDSIRQCAQATLGADEQGGAVEGWVVSCLRRWKGGLRPLERILLVTERAYLLCLYDYEAEDVLALHRVEGSKITKIQRVSFANGDCGLKIHFAEGTLLQNQILASKLKRNLDLEHVEGRQELDRFHLLRPQLLIDRAAEAASQAQDCVNAILKALLSASGRGAQERGSLEGPPVEEGAEMEGEAEGEEGSPMFESVSSVELMRERAGAWPQQGGEAPEGEGDTPSPSLLDAPLSSSSFESRPARPPLFLPSSGSESD